MVLFLIFPGFPQKPGGFPKIALCLLRQTRTQLRAAALAVDPGEAMRAAARRSWAGISPPRRRPSSLSSPQGSLPLPPSLRTRPSKPWPRPTLTGASVPATPAPNHHHHRLRLLLMLLPVEGIDEGRLQSAAPSPSSPRPTTASVNHGAAVRPPATPPSSPSRSW
jgi:hypothetical protein